MRANEVNPDPNTSMIVCSSSLLGLLARESSGSGQQIFVDMFGANAYANFDDMIAYAGKPTRAGLGETLKGPHPLQSLYKTHSGWIYLGISTEAEWEIFCNLIDDQFLVQYPTGFPADASALSKALTDCFTDKTADEWDDFFKGSKIGCVRADKFNLHEFFVNECHDDSPWMTKVQHTQYGDYYRHAPMVSFSRGQPQPLAGTRPGVDGESLLSELGYREDEVSKLFNEGIVWSIDRD